MRVRYFWTVFSVLVIASLGAALLRGYLRTREQIEMLDAQVNSTVADLMDSDLNNPEKFAAARLEKIIAEDLRSEELGMFFAVIDGEGKIIFRSHALDLLGLTALPVTPEWITLKPEGNFIRMRNLHIPKLPDHILQVGIIAEAGLLTEEYLSLTNGLLVAMIVTLGSISAWLLASNLLRPVSSLAEFISKASRRRPGEALPRLPATLLAAARPGSSDEMAQLITSFAALTEKVNRGYKTTRVWSYQMAHELKTPLTLLSGEISRARAENSISRELAHALQTELMSAADTITSFLSWAELSNEVKRELFALHLVATVEDWCARLGGEVPGRIHFTEREDFYVFARQAHLDQVVANLLSNALLHTTGMVEVRSRGCSLTICDRGPGIPQAVLERMGEPFNRDRTKKTRGHGLGLAHVQSVCGLYGWRLDVQSGGAGTTVTITFPAEKEDG